MGFTDDQQVHNWWTPEDILAAVHRVMPVIDLDPATSEEANERVGARRIFTEADNGLGHQWQAETLYCLPPFDLRADFADKLYQAHKTGRVREAIFLMVAETDAEWAQRLLRESAAVCFLRGLTRYYDGDIGKLAEITAPQAQMAVYLGKRNWSFTQAFRELGVCLTA